MTPAASDDAIMTLTTRPRTRSRMMLTRVVTMMADERSRIIGDGGGGDGGGVGVGDSRGDVVSSWFWHW